MRSELSFKGFPEILQYAPNCLEHQKFIKNLKCLTIVFNCQNKLYHTFMVDLNAKKCPHGHTQRPQFTVFQNARILTLTMRLHWNMQWIVDFGAKSIISENFAIFKAKNSLNFFLKKVFHKILVCQNHISTKSSKQGPVALSEMEI